jgi:hypothetical protein
MSGSRLLSLALAVLLSAPVVAWPAPAAAAGAAVALSVGPSIEVNGIVLSGADSFVDAGTTYVPLRAVSAALGARVRWSPEARAVELVLGSQQVQLFIGTSLAIINREVVPLAAPPRLIDGSTYVPLRFVAEAFGATVGWDQAAGRVIITPPADGEGAATQPPAAPADLAALLAEARREGADPAVRLIRYRSTLLAGYVGDAAFYLELARAYVGASDPEGAEIAYRQAIALAPDWAPAYRDLRALLHAAGRHQEIADLYAEAEAKAGATLRWAGHFRYGRALALAELGRYDDAIAQLRQTVEADPNRFAQVENATAYLVRRRSGAEEMELGTAAKSYAEHQGEVVQVVGKIRGKLDAYTFQLGTGSDGLVVQTVAPLAFVPGDTVAVNGTLRGTFTGYNIFGAAVTFGRIVEARVSAPGAWDLELDFE